MGQFVEQPIKSLFNGVSRQPHSVRLTSQMEECDNVMPSVVTGGFEKRPATIHIAVLAALDASLEYVLHIIDRDSTERYAVVLGNTDLYVFDLNTGAQKTVNFPDGKTYLNGLPTDFALVTVADYTFIANKTVTVAMQAATTGTVTGTVQTFAKLPATPAANDIYRIQGDENTSFDDYYVKWDGSVWSETVNPNGQNSFDSATMMYQLVRESDGTFTFKRATWEPRKVGDSTSIPDPEFVSKKISDVYFFRGRLGVSADENVYLSQSSDVFNMWPDKAFQQLDTDPVSLPASTNKVTILRHAVPFRKALFVTADSVQFELSSSDRLTQKTAVLDVTTSYQVDTLAKPAVLGDQLYFAGSSQDSAVVYEYFYDGDSFSNTAADITKHCLGYIPSGIHQIVTSTLADRVFVLPATERTSIYTYTSYWDGTEKAQSAWTRYIFGPDEDSVYIYGAGVVGDALYMLIARGTQVVLERQPVQTEVNDEALGFAPLLDRRVSLTGTYDAGTGWTTWTTPYAHNDDVVVLLGSGFSTQLGRILNVEYPSSTTVRAYGDFSAAAVYAGIRYRMVGEMSRIFWRDQNNAPVTSGRLQLRDFSVAYRNTGYFEVHVTPFMRATRVWKMTGRILGSGLNRIGSPAILDKGVFPSKIQSRSDTCRIEIVNDSPYPSVITGAAWTGFYNNLARQG